MDKSNADFSHERFIEIVTGWQRRLLQLDRRNNLLYFRPGKTAVHIVEYQPDDLVERLFASRNGLTFDYAEPRSRNRSSITATTNPAGSVNNLTSDPYVVQGDLRGDCPPLELQHRLGNLRRRAHEWQEEQGLNVLFLALGFLKWVDEEGEQATAPLLLLPCYLNRASPRDAFVLSQGDDDISANSTLMVKLGEFGVDLPEFDPDTQNPGDYLHLARGFINQKPDWEVTEDIFLATFAYSKLAMWHDLEQLKGDGTVHPIVRTLAGDNTLASQTSDIPSPVPAIDSKDLVGGRMDDLLDIRDHFTVLPADYSQLMAIAAAKAGANLVIHGPPGTGKSQTIVNIIANLIAEGKSVLFVSEKTAALDVVKRRLEEKDLGVFCLDLHSERGSKASVYAQLGKALDDPRLVSGINFSYETLLGLRTRLNRLVRALHQVRQPLGATVFDMHGRFASLRDIPHVGFKVRDVSLLTQERLANIRELAARVAQRTQEFREHRTSRWHVLKVGEPSLELANSIRKDMASITTAVSHVQSVATVHAQELGVQAPRTLEQIARFQGLVEHLGKAPGVPAHWLEPGIASRLSKRAQQEAGQQQVRAELLARLTEVFGEFVSEWDYQSIKGKLSLLPAEQSLLRSLLGVDFSRRLVDSNHDLCSTAEQLQQLLINGNKLTSDLAAMFGVQAPGALTEIGQLATTARTIAGVGPVPEAWTVQRGIATVTGVIERARQDASELGEAEQRLFSTFEPGIVDVAGEEMLIRYRTDYRSWWRRLFGEYKSDSKRLRGLNHTSRNLTFEEELDAVTQAVDVSRRRRAWAQSEAELSRLLGSRFTGRSTDWDSVLTDVKTVETLQREWRGRPTSLAQLLTDEAKAARCGEMADALQRWSEQVTSLLKLLLPQQRALEYVSRSSTLQPLVKTLNDAIPVLRVLRSAAAEPLNKARRPLKDLEELAALMDDGARLVEIEREQTQTRDALSADFGDRYKGFETDWAKVNEALAWTSSLHSTLEKERISDTLQAHACSPQPTSFYQEIMDSIAEATSKLQLQVKAIEERFDLAAGPWETWATASFEQIKEWAEDLAQHADAASDWLIYRAAIHDLNSALGESVVDLPGRRKHDSAAPGDDLNSALGESVVDSIRAVTDDAKLVPLIVERRVIGAWLDWIYKNNNGSDNDAHDNLLSGFTTAEHEAVRSNFRSLDNRHPQVAQTEVRKRVFERYPGPYTAPVKTGQRGILQGELSKRRRQMPVRKLFMSIPNLVQTVKPCFLVSPLAVSQYLPRSSLASETLTFDAVIFDEASQVFPEDAVPAILRGKQLIIVGDQKQLPPSNFWKRSLADDEDEDENDDLSNNQLAGRESILDVAVGQIDKLFTERHLNVHYRSRDESLIRFSNHHFYNDRLLTFPSPILLSPQTSESWQGVHDVYLPNARYDAGGSRTNREEAEKVVEMVFSHMRTRPADESLGVVALSRKQADLIDMLINERRILERDVDDRFAEDIDEPFFVKNLENVQGDERDHMILCIGYGPTTGSGAVPNRFGPINTEGGERRLNVAITRARRRLTVVHSLRATDITSEQKGPRLLRRFLEYVANPISAIEAEATVDAAAESESPFEEAVERALVNRGYKVKRQVGVAGYRIDLAILSEDGSKFDLGIECDGKTYHSAPAARDRDWLRQQVLEGLGWKIHRVWSTSWVRNPEGELKAIDMAVAAARSSQPPTLTPPEVDRQPPRKNVNTVAQADEREVSPPTMEQTFKQYIEASLVGLRVGPQLQYETQANLEPLIQRIAEIEGPVHIELVIDRIRQHYGVGRIGGNMRSRIERAILLAAREGRIFKEEDFIWCREDQLSLPPRRPGEGRPPRSIEHISSYELRSAILATVRAMFGGQRDDVIAQTARNLGFQRTGNRITEVLEQVIQSMLQDGSLGESFGMLAPKNG